MSFMVKHNGEWMLFSTIRNREDLHSRDKSRGYCHKHPAGIRAMPVRIAQFRLATLLRGSSLGERPLHQTKGAITSDVPVL